MWIRENETSDLERLYENISLDCFAKRYTQHLFYR